MLVEFGKIPSCIPIIVLAREFIVSGYRLVAVEQGGTVIAASKWGKIKTVTQMIAIILAFIDKFNFFDFIHATTNAEAAIESSLLIQMSQGEIFLNGLTSIVFVASVIATVFSGANYLKDSKKYLSK
jgi:CDP-diacylglycerol--glycerol-3-phosphate 3-phosphatidyltransferase